MSRNDKTCDVFISHSSRDAEVAKEIAAVCRANGLEAFSATDVPPTADLADAIWEALVESRALLAIVSPTVETAYLAFEVGAASAWNKPIFTIVTDPTSAHLPAVLAGTPVFPLGRIDDAIKSIKLSGEPLSDEDRSHLAKVYYDVGVPVDQLTFDSAHSDELVRRYNVGRGKVVSEERLLAELLRMRKQGKLARLPSATRTRSRAR
jgi:hypothetical protein